MPDPSLKPKTIKIRQLVEDYGIGGNSSSSGERVASSARRDGRFTGSDEPVAFLAHDRLVAREREDAGDPDGLVSAKTQQLDVSFGGRGRLHCAGRWPAS
jgi:hypothetical protein